MTDKKEVVKKKSTEVALPSGLDMSALVAGQGLEEIGQDDIVIPYLRVLQDLSPQVDKDDAEYVDGAESSMFYNTASKEAFDGDKGVVIFPVSYQRQFVEWVPRSAAGGGGLVANHGTDKSVTDGLEQDKGKFITADENEIIPTATFYVLVYNEETEDLEEAIIAMSGTHMQAARDWNTMICKRSITDPDSGKIYKPAPMFCFGYRITSLRKTNDKGKWYTYKVGKETSIVEHELGGVVQQRARQFLKNISTGKVKGDDSDVTEE